MKYLNNKKGFVFSTTGIIILVVLGLIFILGLGPTLKIFSELARIPTWAWIVIGFVILLSLTKEKK